MNYCLTIEEMRILGFHTSPHNHLFTQSSNDSSIIYPIDCEMVLTENGDEIISIFFNNQIYSIQPTYPIIDYRTSITGFDKDSELTHSLENIQNLIINTLNKEDILLGFGFDTDLKLLNIYHPNIIDVRILYPHPDGHPNSYSLKYLIQMYLNKTIQTGIHNPKEDALTTKELFDHFVMNGFIKTNWIDLSLKLEPTIENIIKHVSFTNLLAIYIRGSRAAGTFTENSDYDIFVIVEHSNHINGALIKFGNFDISVYDHSSFTKLLMKNVIWIIEGIYGIVIFEKTNYREFYEEYRRTNKLVCDRLLRENVGFEAARKITSSKRHLKNGNLHYARKHFFIACRFVNYAIQIMTYDKIINIKSQKWLWNKIQEYKTPQEFMSFYKSQYNVFSCKFPKLKKFQNTIQKVNMKMKEQITETKESLIEYLNKNGEDKLKENFGIDYFKSKKHPNLILFSYNIRTPDSLYKHTCRGIILDKSNNYRIVCYPFNNYVKEYKQEDMLYINDKIDGSCAVLYYYNGWNVSTRHNPDGDSIIGERTKSRIVFSELFWDIFNKKYKIDELDKECTYVFEMVCVKHPIIIYYNEDDLYLIGVRNNRTLEERNIYEIDEFKKPERLETIDNLDEMKEGCVITLKNFERVKIKTESYVKKSYMFPLCSLKNMDVIKYRIVYAIQENSIEEFMRYCPKYKELANGVFSKYKGFILKMKEEFEKYKELERMEFVNHLKINNKETEHKYLLAMYNGKNLEVFISRLHYKRIIRDMCL